VPLHSLHQQVMIDIVEEPFDVEVKHPRMPPTPTLGSAQGIVCRAPRSVSIRVFMEYRLKPLPNDHLCNPVSELPLNF
jgi:hypothetical protein